VSADPIRRAWAAWEQHERRMAVQLRIPELHLTDESEPANLHEDREAVAEAGPNISAGQLSTVPAETTVIRHRPGQCNSDRRESDNV